MEIAKSRRGGVSPPSGRETRPLRGLTKKLPTAYCPIWFAVAKLVRLPNAPYLPPLRGLAKDLRISFITTKRAYEELEKSGFIYTLPGKGCYVAPKNVELLREENLKKIEEHIDEVVRLAASCNLSKQDILEMVNFSPEEEI